MQGKNKTKIGYLGEIVQIKAEIKVKIEIFNRRAVKKSAEKRITLHLRAPRVSAVYQTSTDQKNILHPLELF